MFPTTDLHSYLKRARERIGLGNTIFVERATELRVFENLTSCELKNAASRYGLQIVRRLGGRQFEITRLAKV